jgi:hypothetical protein
MNWFAIKAKAQQDVHATFAVPAVYRAAGTMVDVDITARLHTRQEIIGDLDREGFAQILQDVNRVVLDTAEVAAPTRLSRITFPDGRAFLLEAQLATGNVQHQTWEVVSV